MINKSLQMKRMYLNKKLLSILIIVAIMILNHFFIKQGVVNFLLNISITFVIVISCKFSLISLMSVLANYPLIALAFQEFTGKSYGILESSVQNFSLHYYEINFSASIFNCVVLLFIFFTDMIQRESENLDKTYEISQTLINIFCCIAIAATIIYLPRFALISGVDISTRYKHLLPGNAWNYVAIVAILFTTLSRKITIFQIFTYIFVILWFFLNYERVDMLGLLVFLIYRYKNNILNSFLIRKIKYKKIFFSSIASALFVFLFSSSYLRERKSFNVILLMRDVFVQTTSCDIMHVFNTAFEYVDNIGMKYGATYLNYIYKLVPGIGNEFDYSNILDNYIPNPGGGYFLSEPYMNFGYIGITIFAFILIGSIFLIIKYSNSYTYLLYACLVAASFRIMWYGLIYIHKSYVMIIPGLFLFMVLLDKNIFKNTPTPSNVIKKY